MVCNENNLEISLLVMFYMTKDESCETSGVGYCGFWGDGGCDYWINGKWIAVCNVDAKAARKWCATMAFLVADRATQQY